MSDPGEAPLQPQTLLTLLTQLSTPAIVAGSLTAMIIRCSDR
jgi:hypothetical protein